MSDPVPFDENGDLFISLLPMANIDAVCVRPLNTILPVTSDNEKILSSEIESDEEIDAFIASSQSPTRNTFPSLTSSYPSIDSTRINIRNINGKHFELQCVINDNLNNSSIDTKPKNEGLRSEGAEEDISLFTQQTQEFEPLSLEMPATQEFDNQIVAAAERNDGFTQETQEFEPLSIVIADTEDFEAEISTASKANGQLSKNVDTRQSKTNMNFIKNDKTDSLKKFLVRTVSTTDADENNCQPIQSSQISQKNTEPDRITNCSNSDDTQTYELDDMFESQSKVCDKSDLTLEDTNKKNLDEPMDFEFYSQTQRITDPVSPSLLQQEDGLEKEKVDTSLTNDEGNSKPMENIALVTKTDDDSTDSEVEIVSSQTEHTVTHSGPASPPMDFHESSQNIFIKSPSNASFDENSLCTFRRRDKLTSTCKGDTFNCSEGSEWLKESTLSAQKDSLGTVSEKCKQKLAIKHSNSNNSSNEPSKSLDGPKSPKESMNTIVNSIDEVNFATPKPMLPICKQLKLTLKTGKCNYLQNNASHNETDFINVLPSDVDFEAPTQVLPVNVINSYSQSSSPSDAAFFDEPTQIFNNIEESKLLKNRETPKSSPLNPSHGSFFDEPTQLFHNTAESKLLENRETPKSSVSMTNCNELDFEMPTQVLLANVAKQCNKYSQPPSPLHSPYFEKSTRILNNTKESKLIKNIAKHAITETSFDELDFESPTQVFPVSIANPQTPSSNTDVLKSKATQNDTNTNYLETNTSSDDVDFDAATQVMSATRQMEDINHSNLKIRCPKTFHEDSFTDFDVPTQILPSKINKEKTGESVSEKLNHSSLISDPVESRVRMCDSTLNNHVEDDSTDCEADEPVLNFNSKRKNTLSDSCIKPMPLPPDDFDSNVVGTSDDMNEINCHSSTEEEAYLLPTQIDSQSIFHSSSLPIQSANGPNDSGNTNVNRTEKNSTPHLEVTPLFTDSERSSELPTTPEFERQIADAENALVFNRNKPKSSKRNNPNSNITENYLRRPKRSRKATWKMNELLGSYSNTSSDTVYNTSDDCLRDVKIIIPKLDKRTLYAGSAIAHCSNNTPPPGITVENVRSKYVENVSSSLPTVVQFENRAKKYNTRLSLRVQQQCDKDIALSRKNLYHRKRKVRVIESDSDRENRSSDDIPFFVAFAAKPDSTLRASIQDLRGCIVDVHEANAFICDKFRRTIKVMSALSRGIPVVTSKWIVESKKLHSWLNPWDYLLNDVEAEKRYKFSLQESLQKAKASKLLAGYSIFTTENITPRPSEVHKLITCAGGTVANTMPIVWPVKSLVISCLSDARQWPNESKKHVKIVEVQFIINSIIHQSLDFTQPLLKKS